MVWIVLPIIKIELSDWMEIEDVFEDYFCIYLKALLLLLLD